MSIARNLFIGREPLRLSVFGFGRVRREIVFDQRTAATSLEAVLNHL